eukprot:12852_1
MEASMSVNTVDEYKNGFSTSEHPLNPLARVLLMGVYDDTNVLSTFRGMRYLIQKIYEFAIQFNRHHWLPYIDTKQKSCAEKWVFHGFKDGLRLPRPQDININMMPFIMDSDFAKTKLPQYLKPYHPIIVLCLNQDLEQKGKICFLTVHESMVDKGKTQRRPGLHVETPGMICICDELNDGKKGGGCVARAHKMHPWGMGYWSTDSKDGIYMMSSVDGSCAVWNCKIVGDDDGKEAIGYLGDIEHLRGSLPPNNKILMKANQLYWLTDRTPHEALPMKETGYRQFFRLVTHKVGLWYKQHSAANPNVEVDPKITRIIHGSKFDQRQSMADDGDTQGDTQNGDTNASDLLGTIIEAILSSETMNE